MLSWAIIFAVVAVIAGALSFTGVAGSGTWASRVLFLLFLLAVVLIAVMAAVGLS